jgi:23S rRNA (guanosine2251-2'-O)-methyltransferase
MYIYGKQPVLELLRSEHAVMRLLLAVGLESRIRELVDQKIAGRNIPVEYLPKEALQRFCGPVVHQGFVAEIKAYAYISETGFFEKITAVDKPLILVMDQIQDVHNMGAIIRTAEVAGVTAVVLPEKGSAKINETVAKTSAGAIFHCPIHQTGDLRALLEKMAGMQLEIMALVPHRQKTIYMADLNKPLVIVVGSEGRGVRKNLLAFCSQKLSIRQYGRLDSLNVSVAAALALFEALRQRSLLT